MISDIALIAGGFVALFAGGEWLVRGAVSLATRLGLPTLLISLTVVGFGTSTPELLVSLRAALDGQSDIALGNVVGSNTANILLIIGMSALITPMTSWDRSVKRDAAVMMFATVSLALLVRFSVIGIFAGMALLFVLAVYLVLSYRLAPSNNDGAAADLASQLSRGMTAVLIIAGLCLLFAGAEALVRGATGIARDAGVSEAVIGLTVVAVGTSLPELATSLIAAFRQQSDIAIGNIVGSNVFNTLGILGITAVISPISVSTNFRDFDVPVMFAVSALFAALLFGARTIGRATGIALLAFYAIYVVVLYTA
jgi:cation:H+ antiporter